MKIQIMLNIICTLLSLIVTVQLKDLVQGDPAAFMKCFAEKVRYAPIIFIQRFFIYEPQELNKNYEKIKFWRDIQCGEYIISHANKYRKVADECDKIYSGTLSVTFIYEELNQYLDYCETAKEEIACNQFFNISFNKIKYEHFHHSFCNIHLDLNATLELLYAKCPEKLENVTLKLDDYMDQLHLDLSSKYKDLKYYTYEQCAASENNKPEDYYACVFKCSEKNKKESVVLDDDYIDPIEYCSNISFYQNHKSCFDKCQLENLRLSEESTADIRFIDDLCSNDAKKLENCTIPKEYFDAVPECSSNQTIEERIYPECQIRFVFDSLIEDFMYVWAKNDIKTFFELKNCNSENQLNVENITHVEPTHSSADGGDQQGPDNPDGGGDQEGPDNHVGGDDQRGPDDPADGDDQRGPDDHVGGGHQQGPGNDVGGNVQQTQDNPASHSNAHDYKFVSFNLILFILYNF